MDKQKIEANKWTLFVAIQLLSGVNAKPEETEFDVCDKKILNGEFELEVGNTVIVPNVSCAVFDTKGRTDMEKGLWKEFDLQFIVPNTEIKPRLKLCAEAEANTNVYFAMHVVSVAKNGKLKVRNGNDCSPHTIEKLAKDCADREMMFVLHGCPKPSGLQRAYPNIVNFEAMRGAECNKGNNSPNLDYHLQFIFIRMLAGPLEYC